MHSSTLGTRLTEDQLAALARIPEHEDAVLPAALKTVPTEIYTDPARFELEREQLFRKTPVAAAATAELPQPGSYLRRDLMGVPLLITRARDGEVRAFLNVCRHRGVLLCTDQEAQCSQKIVCPYHAWTYGLDGRLVGVPREEIFPGLDKAAHNLTPLPCREAGGLIWVGLTPEVNDFSGVDEALRANLESLGLPTMSLFAKKTYEIKANWKLVADTQLDNYHVIRLHRNTLAKYFVDTPIVIDTVGRHIRSTSARANFSRAALGDDVASVRQVAVIGYVLFPNCTLVLSPEYLSVIILRPRSFEATDVDYLLLTDASAPDEALQRRLQKSFDLMDRAFGQEDFWVAEQAQIGLKASDLKNLTLGGMEAQMALFHETVEAFLAPHER